MSTLDFQCAAGEYRTQGIDRDRAPEGYEHNGNHHRQPQGSEMLLRFLRADQYENQ
jgi:hypothetical protein